MSEPSALIFNIVHGSFVDGPGIRTTVFLKGCPLRCRWCCNPEGQSYQNQLRLQGELCTGCGQCLDVCPRGAISLREGTVQVDRERCDACGACEGACWFGALTLWARRYTVSQLLAELLPDLAFYEQSGGGVTIGGGEAATFPHFCLPLMDALHLEGIHVAVDTCGYAVTEEQREVLRRADLLLFDVKGLDEGRHIRNTGRSNRPILDNLLALDALGKPTIIRCPVIPGYNRDEMEQVADFLAGLSHVQRVDLIGYHEYGSVKYPQTGMVYDIHTHPLAQEELDALRDAFAARGLTVQLGG